MAGGYRSQFGFWFGGYASPPPPAHGAGYRSFIGKWFGGYSVPQTTLKFDPRFLTLPFSRVRASGGVARISSVFPGIRVAATAAQRRGGVTYSAKRITVTARIGPAMPQGNDFSPVDATETVTVTWDFAPWLGTGVTLSGTPLTTTCGLRSGVDPSPATRLTGAPSVVASPSSGKPSQGVQQQVTTMKAGAAYFLTCTAGTSDGQTLTLWGHIRCLAET